MPPFQNLKAWQHAHRLAVECGRLSRTFPPHDYTVLAKQLLRASISVQLNIAEGAARRGSREFRRFLDTARGSLAEVESALQLARDLGYVPNVEYERVEAIATETAKTLWGLLRKVGASPNRPAD